MSFFCDIQPQCSTHGNEYIHIYMGAIRGQGHNQEMCWLLKTLAILKEDHVWVSNIEM